MSLQYSGSYNTDACVSPGCAPVLSATSSLPQGEVFMKMTANYHGGKRRRAATRKSRKAHRRASRKARRSASRTQQRGGAGAPYPGEFSALLPQDMHAAADITKLDQAYAQLPEFAGKYGMSGGALAPAAANAPSMILSAAEEPKAFLNPQWYTENQVVPSFKGPENALVAQQAPQFAYAQKAGKRKTAKKSRKAAKKSRKAAKKGRKATRKASRKAHRKASRKAHRKASRKQNRK
jgi:hypothetical protein